MGRDRRDVDLRGAHGVQVGDGGIQLNFFAGPTRAGLRAGAYLGQVRRIAPPDLLGRDEELAKLARFCSSPDARSYTWWRAGPWAGKSALLATFVLHPPAGVQIVSFFITARLASQDTREAFTEVLLQQLAELTGQGLPTLLPEATRDAYLLDLLAQAAVVCQRAGERLVLVVDGLDEDRGVTAGPDAHSIAALLPTDPPAGMRVIVAGRPNPPIPDDVPNWHPLRDQEIVYSLPESPYARNTERLARYELQHLLHGSELEQDLLGLVTAARGGLSGADLEELTDSPLGKVEEILHTVAGRTFTRRLSQWAPETGPEVYLLAHEELQAAAARYFGHRLASYRDRLHAWAHDYQAQSWPPATPEYLLSGYYSLLIDLGDLPRMIACAGDTARHERMLNLTCGDGPALAELRSVLDLIAAQDIPDLASALCLACHRDLLADRNASLPSRLPAIWAILGQTTRAEALAGSIRHADEQAEALTRVAKALARAGESGQAARIAGQAERVAGSIPDESGRARVLGQIAEVLALAGRPELAARVAGRAAVAVGSILSPERRVKALAEVSASLARMEQHTQAKLPSGSPPQPAQRTEALGQVAEARANADDSDQAAKVAGQAEAVADSAPEPSWPEGDWTSFENALAMSRHQQAETIARSFRDPSDQANALAQVGEILAEAASYERAARIAELAEMAARSVTVPDQQANTLVELAMVLTTARQYEQAARVAGQAEVVARSIPDQQQRAEALAPITVALAEAEHYQQAETVARSIPDPGQQAKALAPIAGALARAGQYEQAARVAGQAEVVARSIPDQRQQAEALAPIAGALARTGQYEQAEAVARSIPDHWQQAKALARVVGVLARAGQYEQAEAVARSIPDQGQQAEALTRVAGALAETRQFEQAARLAAQAEVIARSIAGAAQQSGGLASVAEALAKAGQYEQAETVARSICSAGWHWRALADVAEALARAGRLEQGEAVARSIPGPGWQELGLAQAFRSLARVNKNQEFEATANSLSRSGEQGRALAGVAAALAWAGQDQQAEAVAHSIVDPGGQAHALGRVAEALAGTGRHRQAARVFRQAEETARSITDLGHQTATLARLAEALARTGDTHSAHRIAAAICVSGRWTVAAKTILPLNLSALAALARVLDEKWHLQITP